MTTAFDQLFALAVAGAFGLYLVRCLAGALLYLCAQLPTRWSRGAERLSAAVTPRLARRLLVFVLGAAGAIFGASPALAAGMPDLDRGPTSGMALGNPTGQSNEPLKATRQRVRDGDSLWELAHRQLGSSATARQIDRQWRHWYNLNRTAIGCDPDVIRTGMWLRVPTTAVPNTSPASADRSAVTK